MNLDSLSFALSQISYSVANLTKKNYKSSVAEITHLVAQHGAEADGHLFRCLFSHVDFTGDGKSSGKDFHQTQFLIQECATLITKPNFISTLCHAIDNPLHYQKTIKPSAHLFSQLSKVLKLSKVQEVVFGIALLNSSNADTRSYAAQFVKHKLPDLLRSYIDVDTSGAAEGGLQDIAIEVLHLLLTHLVHEKDQFGIGSDQKEAFLKTLRKDFPQDRVPVVLAPVLYPETQDVAIHKLLPGFVNRPKMEGSLAEMILELGYGCTASIEECRSTLAQFGVRELTSASVARVLGVMARTPTGLTDQISVQSLSTPGGGIWGDGKDKADSSGLSTWNVDVFVQVVQDMVPHLSWREVIAELDHPGFMVNGKTGLRILVQGLFRGLMQEVFSVESFFKPWKNLDGQLSFITNALKHPDVFCFADYPCHTVVIEILKTPPDDDNREIATWKSLDLVETLLRLYEAGHFQQVTEMFKFPLQHCPDMLVLALLQIPVWNTLKQDLLSNLMPIFLGNHPNSAIVLHYAWHCQGQSTTIRTLIMHSMAEWYMRGEQHDQSRLSRILDVAQDLKALSMLLNATPFAFVIDLACLASRREYLKLDKWLSDKIREHGEQFVQACVNFLKRRCPQLYGGQMKDEPQNKSQQLPTDTLTTMLHCLQAFAGNVAQELSEAILTMVSNAHMILNKQRQPPVAMPTKPVNPGLPNLTSNPMDLGSMAGGVVGNMSGIMAGGLSAGLGGGLSANLSQSINSGLSGGLSGNMGGGLSGGMSGALAGGMAGGMGALAGLGAGVSGVGTGFPQNLASLNTTPGSPAKAFPNMNPSSQGQPFGMQSITASIQGLNLPSTMSTGMSSGRTPTLGSLSASAAIKQQQNAERLRQTGQTGGADLSSIFPEMNQQFTKEIEDEANSYFQRIYNHPPHPTISIDEVLEMLKRFKDSPVKKEREVFACMLRNLFEEYRFFPQYPDKELHTTAVLFGGIIEQGLVTYMSLGIALRYVLEALRKPHGSKMYYFGIAALDRFKTRLKDYPQYCQHVASIPHFSQFAPHLMEYVEYGARSTEPPNRPQGPSTSRSLTPVSGTNTTPGGSSVGAIGTGVAGVGGIVGVSAPGNSAGMGATIGPVGTTVMPGGSTGVASTNPLPPVSAGASVISTTITTTLSTVSSIIAKPTSSMPKPSIANATNIDTLLAGTEGKEEISVPPEALQDKVFFIFNNLSKANINTKSEELRENIGDEYMMWVAQYMVMKRASIEPNFHTLYASFLDTLKYPSIMAMVVKETFRNIKVLLRSDKGVANFSDRSLLKNLGHWLGLLTLAKNKPILHVDLDLKSLVFESYHKGTHELLYVIPFVAKVLESCSKSKVFKPPNPWLMGIMNVLAELHGEPNLKLNLKFEIEVLCKTLNIDINDLKPGTYLKEMERLNSLEFQLSSPTTDKLGIESSSTPQPEEPTPVVNVATPISTPTSVPTVLPTIPTPPTPTTPAVSTPPEPTFTYGAINQTSMAGLAPHININEQLGLFQAHPQMRQYVRPAIERAVQELLHPVVERSIKIALTTCEQIVKKDFALDPEEARMRAAAHHMVRNMTASMALITCREPLLISINNNLKTAFLAALRGATQPQKELIEQAAQLLSQDNTELACCFIQKTAVERAIPEMDKRLATEFELRKHARNEGRRYCDPVVLTYQAERMPEQIRLKVGGVTPQQIAVYEEFARNIPGFRSSESSSQQLGFVAKPAQQQSYATDEITQIYDKITRDIEQHLHAVTTIGPQVAALHNLLDAVLLARNSREIVTALALLQKAVEGLLDGLTQLPSDPELMLRFRDCHVLVLRGLQDHRAYGPQWTNKQVTRCLIECREEFKYNLEAVDVLIRSHLVNMQQYDLHLAQAMENGLNYMAVAFGMQLVQRFCMDHEKPTTPVTEADFYNTIETLARIAAHSRQAPEGLTALIETIRQHNDGGLLDRAPGGPTSMMHSGISQAREFDDPPGLHENTENLLRDWVNMFHSPQAGRDSTKAFSAFVAQMHQRGILKTDDLITRFFRLCTEMCVDLCYRALSDTQTHSPTMVRVKCFHTLDAFVRLIALLVKHSGDSTNQVTKINLLNKVLGIVAGVLLQDHEVRHTEFQQLPYHRIFIMLFIELNAPEYVLDSINFQVLTAFCNTFHVLRPAKAPGFAYAWLELVSHRVFIGRMLLITPQQRGWGMYAQLLIDLFKFLSPFLRNAELTKPTQLLYKGTLRVLLVLLHDFPEFLCDYHYAFCDVIPPNCIQMRNLILSAFPRNMRLPDPFTPNLKVDMLPEIAHTPRIITNFANVIQPAAFKKDLDSYLKTRSPVTFLSDLRSNLQVSSEPGMRYNISLLNALVLYVGTQAISYIHNKGQTPTMTTIAHSSHMDIFQNLAVDLDTEGRYLFLNAIANQLRFPNSHTHYFSCSLLYLFAEANTEAIQEQITRVLLERLIVNRPHPWGLLITFIELIKNPTFKFWNHEFVHCAPEIEKLFESVAKSCMQPKQVQTLREGEVQEVH